MSAPGVWRDWPLIIAHHSVSEGRRDNLAVRADDFEYQLRWFQRRGYRSMTLGQFTSTPVPKGQRIVILTFDDGYVDNYEVAFPIMQRYGFVGTIFLVSDYVGSDRLFPWDQAKPATSGERALYRAMGWDQVREMAAAGMEFGSHTLSHPHLPQLPPQEQRREMVESRDVIQHHLGQEVSSFCYPFGDVDEGVIRLAAEVGYAGATVTVTRPGIPLCRHTLRRVGLYQNSTPLRFRIKINRLMRRYREQIG